MIVLLDTSHSFATNWRTYFRKIEFRRAKNLYIYLPIALISASIFIAFSPNGVTNIAKAAFVIVTVHGFLQSFGILKWYQRKNGILRPWTNRFFILLVVVPFLYSSSKSPLWNELFFRLPIFLSKSSTPALYVINVFVIIFWLIYEIVLWRRADEWNRALAMFFSVLLVNCAIIISNPMDVVFAFKIHHALTYFVVTSMSTKRLSQSIGRESIFKSPSIPALIFYCSLPAIFLYQVQKINESLFGPLVIGIIFGNFCVHVAYDSFLWKRTHPDAAIIYQ